MLPNRLGILGVLALLPAVVQVGSGLGSRPTTTRIFPRRHGPMQLHERRSDGTTTSTNWSGYAVTGSSFTEVQGSWVVPSVTCSVTPNTYSSFWVGLDGYSSNTVEQTGTDSDCEGTTPVYYAWYEFYPQNMFEISSLSIKAGDKMSASVVYSGSEFTVTITDTTTGKSYTKSSSVHKAQRTSAEWIVEAPCCTRRGGILPLADFGTASLGFTYTSVTSTNDATENGATESIGAFGSKVWELITMVNGTTGANEAVPSPLSADGSSFQVVWKSE